MRKHLASFVTFIFIVASLVSTAQARTQLTKTEVQELFIEKHWRSPSGTFYFKRNGTYTYRQGTKARGPWKYKLTSKGVIIGLTTRYTFYRKSNGNYEYYHSRNMRYVPAFVK